ncbi:putative RDD family membrane protein YckC [Pseudochelatococcus lubricantis]|uniref:RDD family membrane protein YckC n=1 Tax=Pseudochelatococcus lubricantis TaxID=1538102 RepID=A0ABX0UUA7_9HYPH|nr:RDD family protein [Pseudochelatococcus lubricantis]NIJ56539.1 putative RDD family membrane protein YckC [Pseudochelatococcus lubricantis]
MTQVPAPLRPRFDTRGVLTGRFFAYLVDAVIIFMLTIALGWVIALLGIVTFGVAWLLFPLLAGTGVIYSAITVGGEAQATIGMRWLGLRVVGPDGARVDFLIAAVHAIFFYIAIGTCILFVLDVLTALVRDDRRMLHDVLTGVTVTRS